MDLVPDVVNINATTLIWLPNKGATYKGLIIVNKVKSRNMFSDIGAGFKSLVGGEIKVSKYRKQISKFSFEPKTNDFFLYFCPSL